MASVPDEIERVALLGWKVWPASRQTRAGCFKGAHLAATDDLNQLARWAREYNPNWRVVFGPSGLWGLDIDRAGATHAADGIGAMAALVKVHGPLPTGPRARSGGGGVGLFYRHTGERIAGRSGTPAPGIDPRRGMLSQTIPPSRHTVTGLRYRWLVPPWEVAPPVAPAWLVRLVSEPPEQRAALAAIDTTDQARRRLYRAALAVIDAPEGARNDTLNRRAWQMGRMIGAGLLDEREAAEALYGAARQASLDHDEIRNTIRSGIRSGCRHPVESANGRPHGR